MRFVAVALLLVSCSLDSHVLNGYQSPMGMHGKRGAAHTGVDFEGTEGDPVLAASDGVVVDQIEALNGVGICVLLEHHCSSCKPAMFFTSYCHLKRTLVTSGQPVARGQQIAELGKTGKFSGGVPHLHLSMCRFPCTAAVRDGDFRNTSNPMDFDIGCFDPQRQYLATARPILTHPIVCTGR
ncbi:MAG: M23 family metallopeptidase [Deltaproteobacteria bacterium]|nr:M23 family metallopeptidase [Deltaproteobacteria bacterium]